MTPNPHGAVREHFPVGLALGSSVPVNEQEAFFRIAKRLATYDGLSGMPTTRPVTPTESCFPVGPNPEPTKGTIR